MAGRNKTTKEPDQTAPQQAKPTKNKIAQVFEKTKNKAEGYLNDPKKAKKLLEDATQKAKSLENNRGPLGEVWNYLTALFRLLKAYIRGEYRDIPWTSIVPVVAIIIYFVSPVDLIPDAILGVGFMDDAALIAYVVTQVKADIDNFLAWEMTQVEDDESPLTESST